MFRVGLLDKILYYLKKLIPKSVFNSLAPFYHTLLAYGGAVLYGFPSRSMKIIGVTGTKGKSTVTFLISRILEESGKKVAAIGSLGYKIKDKEWPNTLKMTMPGRFRLQKFLAQAKKAGCEYVVLEVTSEGIKQKRHLGIKFDCAVFTNLHKEHIESHGSFENYMAAKQELFEATRNIHILNADDPHVESFSKFPAKQTMFFGLKAGEMRANNIHENENGTKFEVYGTYFDTRLVGEFNILNCLAALATGAMYGLDLPTMAPAIEKIRSIPGRMEFIQHEPFTVVVDYAHTPDSLTYVYKTLDSLKKEGAKLIAILGAAGGGRDTWKRPEFGKIAAEYCDSIILTNEDPYEEDPEKIIEEIRKGIPTEAKLKTTTVLDRKEAIAYALTNAQKGDIVVITGKGSETSIATSGGKRISWSDSKVVRDLLSK